MAEGDIRTLVVDDSEFFADMTAETLTQEHDMEAISVHSGTAAAQRLVEEEFDCVVSDYEMPEMDGLELLSTVREEDPSLPFILLTGRGDEETASQAIRAGVADYLLKLEVVEDKQYGRLANRIESVVKQDRTRKKFESLVANSPDGIAHITAKGVVLSANPSLADRLGTTPDALAGERLTDVMDTETARRRVAAVRRAIEDGETVETEDSLDGRHYQNQFVPVESHRERATAQLVSRDVTERVERQRELERQNERLEEFASVVSHDLRNPLNVAASALDLLDVEDDEMVAKIDRSLDRMGDIIEDVLTLAREGRAVQEPEWVTVDSLAEKAWADVATDEATLSVTATGEIEVDPTRGRDLFANLFRNAVEHNDGPVRVEVGSLSDGFYVADDGTGIDDDSEVFEMGHSTADDGTGIGLAIVAQIADAHGWGLDLTESESGGARFELTGVTQRE
ncbi:hybrid sensor histidine kinase/response regulator [Haloarcula onubensis]|uniref:histidine kinase n=1 Tax=Haloarcula onubensis TaxID=2950539 RepID=A0ABU2FLN9_9EURY|nr:response regulator [Halomicroarcula sp. S3CR25-11]MDS0281683.1 response regulator [Halomicroarcula sp. S3CR25-11]